MITLKLGCAFLLMCRAHLIPKSNSHIHTFENHIITRLNSLDYLQMKSLVYFKRYISSVNYDKKIPNGFYSIIVKRNC